MTANWTAPTNFYASTPTIVTQNAGSGGIGWTDFWIICDATNCFMFFTNQKGYLFRSQTSAANFPSGFGDPVVVMQSSYLVQGGRIYKVSGGSIAYLMLIEGTGSGGAYIGAWSATALDGKWTALAETEANPFAHATSTASGSGGNITFAGTVWTWDVGHGELVRSTYDETMTVDNCNMRYLYAGKDHFAAAKAEPYPWKLGLLVRSK
jgi:endo-1,4-beta-xylanase